MGTKKVIFGDMNPSEIEIFEKKINGLIIHNAIGENSLMISPSAPDNNYLVIQADKIEEKEVTDYPNLFFLSEQELIRLYNFLVNFFSERPESFQFKYQKKNN